MFLNPTGKATYGIAICARCARKFFLEELHSDPNSPGLMVCKDDLDVLDPYRLPPPPEDQITLPFVRPDESIAITGVEVVTGPTTPYTFWSADFWSSDFWSTDFWS
jgi:hypothetical protein